MTTDGKQEGTPPEEGDDALWRLLERAPRPGPVSPYFARRVLREVALLEGTQADASHWLARTWQALRRSPGLAVACVLVAAALVVVAGTGLSTKVLHSPVAVSRPVPVTPDTVSEEPTVPTDAVVDFDPAPQPTMALLSDPVVNAQDVEIIADLDNLLSREESRLWTEDDTARF